MLCRFFVSPLLHVRERLEDERKRKSVHSSALSQLECLIEPACEIEKLAQRVILTDADRAGRLAAL